MVFQWPSSRHLPFIAIPYTLLAIALIITAVVVYQRNDPRTAAIAGTVLSLLALPASAEVHFVLLGIPVLLLPLRTWELAIVGAVDHPPSS